MTEQDLIKRFNKRVEARNKLVDQHNRVTRWAFLIATIFLFGFMLTFEYFFK